MGITLIKIINSNEHYKGQLGWLTTFHHFSFGEYRNPEKVNFGPLRVFNEDFIQPGKGFGFHPHNNMEIVTFVLDGTLQHKDTMGNEGIIEAGEVQRMTAGTGVFHSEYNHSNDKVLHLLQMWVFPDEENLKPSWEQKKFSKQDRTNRLLPIISQNKTNSSLTIHQDTSFYVSRLEGILDHNFSDNRLGYLFVIDGKLNLNGQNLSSQDAAMISNEKSIKLASNGTCELIMIDLPEKFKEVT